MSNAFVPCDNYLIGVGLHKDDSNNVCVKWTSKDHIYESACVNAAVPKQHNSINLSHPAN